MIGIESEKLSQELKAPLASFFLKVVAQRPRTHHLEECSVALVSY